jgi:dephospho-CoA kinase
MTLVVGITGSFASGKTFVLNYLSGLGYKVFSSDDFVHSLYKDSKVQQQILNIFPTLPYFDKKQIASIIYKNDEARTKLQGLIHPLVRKGIEGFKHTHKSERLVFLEVPLLFESSFEHYFAYIVTTFCSEKSRLERAKMRVNFDPEIYEKINQIQLSQEEKIKKSNFAVNTDSNLLELESEVDRLLQILLRNK